MMSQVEILPEIINRLIDTYKPQEIILFGSRAWGSEAEESDVDLCIILSESGKSQADRIRDGLRALKGIKVPIDLLVLTQNEINEQKEHPSTLIYKILHNGKKLYAAA